MTERECRLRDVEPRDFQTLRELRLDIDSQRQLMSFPGELTDFEAWLSRRGEDLLFAVVAVMPEDQCAGFVQLTRFHRRDRHAHLGIAVDSKFRSRGVGRCALRRLVDEARRLALRKLLLEVRADNGSAISLYLSENFRIVGELNEHYDDGTKFVNVVIMERLL